MAACGARHDVGEKRRERSSPARYLARCYAQREAAEEEETLLQSATRAMRRHRRGELLPAAIVVEPGVALTAPC